ncbi:MAG: hypothetical protein ACR2PC_02285 [Tsuneonella suprasediminis]
MLMGFSFLGLGFPRSGKRRAETLPVGETGVATDKGGRAGGGSPGLHAMKWRKVGDTGQDGEASLDRREGNALSHHGAASTAPRKIQYILLIQQRTD